MLVQTPTSQVEKSIQDTLDLALAIYQKPATEIIPSLFAGDASAALFLNYYARYTGKEEFKEKGLAILERCFDLIAEEENLPLSICSGITGVAWTLLHLANEGMADVDEEIFEEIDDVVIQLAEANLSVGDIDYLHGALGYIFFLIERLPNPKIAEKLEGLIQQFIDLSKTENNKKYWISNLEESEINFGLAHGLAGILIILSKCHKKGIAKSIIEPVIQPIVDYINQYRLSEEENYLFPTRFRNGTMHYRGRLAWCHGDLGIALAYDEVGKNMQIPALQEDALSIALHSTKIKDSANANLVDVGICHGDLGVAHIYQRFYQRFGDQAFQLAASHWRDKGLERIEDWGGLFNCKVWFPGESRWRPTHHLIDGSLGAGLVLLGLEDARCQNWDRVFLLS